MKCFSYANYIAKGEFHIEQQNGDFREGKADVIYLMGDDGRPDDEPRLVIRPWIDPAMNFSHYPAWYRCYWDEVNPNKWEDQETVYGPNQL